MQRFWLEATRQGIDDGQAQVVALQEQGRHAEALEVARTTANLLSGAEATDPALRERTSKLLAQATARVEEEQRRLDLERRNTALLARCEHLLTVGPIRPPAKASTANDRSGRELHRARQAQGRVVSLAMA